MNIAIIVALFTLIFTRLLGMPHDALSLPSGFFSTPAWWVSLYFSPKSEDVHYSDV